ncbi:MAG: hypothetical protein KBF83_09195 [Pyrinomonadaceae bacterium]|nr:hypothetical protein [Pyrinomonadaceae bacterium]
MIRELISRFSRSFSERTVSNRRHFAAPVRVWFDPETNTERSRDAARSACILGETMDISRSGIGFIVGFIRLKEKYLVGHERPLNIEIDLPNGKVFLRAIGRRYEKVGANISAEKFLIGATILSLTGTDKEIYETFLRNGTRGLKIAARNLELGTDQ